MKQIVPSTHRNSSYTGKERDTESDNDYFGARYYSSNLGRFMSPDWSARVEPVPYAKLDDPQSLNLYAYVRNNPATGFDPDGHNFIQDKNQEWIIQHQISNPDPSLMLAAAVHPLLAQQQSSNTNSAPVLVQGKPKNTGQNNGYLLVTWTLKNTKGKKYYVSENQTVRRLAGKPSGRSTDMVPNQFDDEVGTTPAYSPVNSIQTFDISQSTPNKDGWSLGSMHVDVEINGVRYYGVQIHIDATKGGPGTYETGYNPPTPNPEQK